MATAASWLPWALSSAVFAALTAIFAKIGLEGIDSDFATLLRTVVIVAVLAAFVAATGKWRSPLEPGGGIAVVGLDPHAGGDRWWIYDYFPSALAADLRRSPATTTIRALFADAGFGEIDTRIAQLFVSSVPVLVAQQRGSLQRTSTSQLLVIDDAEWEAGMARLTSAPDTLLETDLRLYVTTAWLPA